jgi:hypothetical protein
VFVPGKPFQPNLMFVGEARSLPKSGASERALHSGRPRPYIANIRLGWKGLPGTNTLAYYENL